MYDSGQDIEDGGGHPGYHDIDPNSVFQVPVHPPSTLGLKDIDPNSVFQVPVHPPSTLGFKHSVVDPE
jgi:hypothetical protein